MEAKTPEDIYKTNLSDTRTFSNVDSARQNLASTFVNAFVNAGFGQDKLVLTEEGTPLFPFLDKTFLSIRKQMVIQKQRTWNDECGSFPWYDSIMGCGWRSYPNRQISLCQ